MKWKNRRIPSHILKDKMKHQDAQLLNLAFDIERMYTQYLKKRKSYIFVNIWEKFEDNHFKFVIYLDRRVCYQKAESHDIWVL